MKLSHNFKTIFKTFIAVVTVSVLVSACSKDKSEPQQLAGLKVINSFVSADSLDFIIDQTRVNNKFAFNYNGIIGFNATNKVGYLSLYPGIRTLGIAKRGVNKFLATEQKTLVPGVGYSMFVLDTVKTNTKKFLILEDDLTDPATDKAKVRFVNLAKDATALSVRINGKDADLFSNKGFYEYTPFAAVDPGESVTFNINENATVATTVPNVKIEKGKIYTIYAKGLKAATVDSLKLKATIYTH